MKKIYVLGAPALVLVGAFFAASELNNQLHGDEKNEYCTSLKIDLLEALKKERTFRAFIDEKTVNGRSFSIAASMELVAQEQEFKQIPIIGSHKCGSIETTYKITIEN